MSEITKEQLAVIEAATAWLRNHYAVTKTIELVDAIGALPKPYYEPLVSDGELQDLCDRDTTNIQDMREALILGLHGMSERLADNGYLHAADVVKGTAEGEEKLND